MKKTTIATNPRHFAVWIGHKDATIFHIGTEGFEEGKVKSSEHELTRKQKDWDTQAGSELFFHEVAEALREADEVLILGTYSATLAFMGYVHKSEHEVEPKILGTRVIAHPRDGELVAYANQFFVREDRQRALATAAM